MKAIARVLAAFALILGMVIAPLHLPAAQALASTRYAGADRFGTSVEISKWSSSWAESSTVFLASGLKFPDALAAGPVAAAERAHLLLTRPDRIDPVVMDRIRVLDPTEVVIVGSTSSISAAVAEQVRSAVDATITRIGGVDRVETSLLLMDRLVERSGPVSTVWVASGHNFPDALVAASVAGRTGAGIVLDYHSGSAAGSESWRQRIDPYVRGRVVNIAGGTPSVSAYDAQVLRYSGTSGVFRYSGADRYQTARAINDTFAPRSSDGTMLLATGQNFPDALSGAVLAALRGVPLYLTTTQCHGQISEMLRGEAGERGISTVIGLGSAASISAAALSLEPCPVSTAPSFSALQRTMGERYGMFAPRNYSGSGDEVIDLGAALDFGIVRADMRGSGNNIVWAMDSAREDTDLLVNTIGAHSGTSLFGAMHSQAARYLEVQADGPWSLQVRDIRYAAEFGGSSSGSVDEVLLYGGAAGTLSASYSGDANFIVLEHFRGRYGDESDLLFNEIGAYSGAATLNAGPAVIEVISDGPWSLRRR